MGTSSISLSDPNMEEPLRETRRKAKNRIAAKAIRDEHINKLNELRMRKAELIKELSTKRSVMKKIEVNSTCLFPSSFYAIRTT